MPSVENEAPFAPEPQHLDTSISSRSTATNSSFHCEELLSKRRKETFGDCALIEIIHLHDCLRGALKALESDVNDLTRFVNGNKDEKDVLPNDMMPPATRSEAEELSWIADLERRVAGRFKVIWSVFKSHSEAEDEFIWPALKIKSQGVIDSSPKNSPKYTSTTVDNNVRSDVTENDILVGASNQEYTGHLEQEEYKEDHADEERMFSEMDTLLSNFREALRSDFHTLTLHPNDTPNPVVTCARVLSDHTHHLSQHLMAHLEKEETQCMPLVVKYLGKDEIHELVGNIMGKRSADTIAQIMTMAVQNLDVTDREEMVKYMKQSMAGTFFDRWLTMSGWNGSSASHSDSPGAPVEKEGDPLGPQQPYSHCDGQESQKECRKTFANDNPSDLESNGGRKREADPDPAHEGKRLKTDDDRDEIFSQVTEPSMTHDFFLTSSAIAVPNTAASVTSQAELEKLIRAIASNPSLTPSQKNTTIQGLRDSVWKSNQRQKDLVLEPPTVVNVAVPPVSNFLQKVSTSAASIGSIPSSTGTRQMTTPSMYFKKSADGKIELVCTSENPMAAKCHPVPLFSAAELAPTYHDGASGAVLGCPHYARACKLRHPTSGRLYTCRLCCEQTREMPMKDKDEPLDRYAVTEVMCMKCNAVQPAEDRCINSDCESRGKPFARYFCRICHLYDDGSRPIFHCPYCNACRLGLGLGIDFRHCMRCNACVSLGDTEHHCIPQSLQGNCPICRESLFESTEPLRGLKCGHVMHLACFTDYRRGLAYTCPLCKQSMEDMKDYFALLDTAIRMQPMPAAYLSTFSNILCQDCGETGRTRYHFVGQKCPSCASYNTRELGRVHESPNSSPRAST